MGNHKRLCGLFALVVVLGQEAGATTLEVPGSYPTIQAAIDAAIAGDVVLVAPGVYRGTGNRNINFRGKSITVRGTAPDDLAIVEATVIDAQRAARGFSVQTGEGLAVLEGVTVVNGSATAGGAILCTSTANATIRKCVFRGNLATSGSRYGSAVYSSTTASIVLEDCIFLRNGSGVTGYGSGVAVLAGNAVVDRCQFLGNAGAYGGGIYVASGAGNIQISACTLVGNTAGSRGGGLYLAGSEATVTGCQFIANSGSSGGALALDKAQPLITNCSLLNNRATSYGGGIYATDVSTTPVITHCTLAGNDAGTAGGAMYCTAATPTVCNCILWANGPEEVAKSGVGPTVTYSDVLGGYPGEGNLDVDPLLWLNGDARPRPGSGCIDAGTNTPAGGLPAQDAEDNPRSLDGDGDGNSVPDMGAYELVPGRACASALPQVLQFSRSVDGPNPPTQSIVIRNSGSGILSWQITGACPWVEVTPASGTGGTSIGDYTSVTVGVNADGLEPGDYLDTLVIGDGTAASGYCQVYVLLHVGRVLNVPGEYATIGAAISDARDGDHVIIADGTYTGSGSNCDLSTMGKAITIRSLNGPANCVIDCQGTYSAPHRALVVNSGEGAGTVISGLTFSNGYGPTYGSYSSGGAILLVGTGPRFVNCVFSANKALNGGAICGTSGAAPTLAGCTFVGGGLGNGGAIYLTTGSLTLSDCQFTGNRGDQGGALYLSQCNATISQCAFKGNKASSYTAGAIYCMGGSHVLTGCQIENNTSPREAGGIHLNGGTLALTDCTLLGNRAGSDGGGAQISGALELTRCRIERNRSDGYFGGGIKITNGALSARDCSFVQNSVWRQGAGIAVGSTSASFVNCLISGNQGGFLGGGVYCSDSSDAKPLNLVNCTMLGNVSGYGGAVSYAGTGGQITNCILWDDDATFGPEIHVQSGALAVSFSDVEGGVAATYREGGAALDWGSGNLSSDPLLTFATDPRLMPGSPCIDAGTSAPPGGLPTADYEGAPRSVDGDGDGDARADLGAYELAPLGPTIAASVEALTLRAVAGDPDGVDQMFSIRNRGGGSLDWQASADAPWLLVTPPAGSSQGEISELLVHADVSTLAPGTYSAQVSIHDGQSQTLSLAVTLLVGRVLEVPADYATIQAAINAAAEADLVLVADGTYTGTGNKDLDFGGKNITVRGQHGRELCIIDCQQQGRGFYFHSGETADATIEGLTIRNGGSGGVYCSDGSSPTIRGCAIRNCAGVSTGGGLFCTSGDPTVQDCIIDGCQATGSAYGGGICCWVSCSPKILNTTISNNTATDGAYGGGISIREGSRAIIQDCSIRGNYASYGGGLCFAGTNRAQVINCLIEGNTGHQGGGVHCRDSASPVLLNCTLRANLPIGTSSSGVGLYGEDSWITLRGVRITGNVGQYYGGGIGMWGGGLDASNCLIDSNTAQAGGGVFISNKKALGICNLTNCTLVGNTATNGAGGGLSLYGTGTVLNTIFRQNTASSGRSIALNFSATTLSVAYSDLPAGSSEVSVTAGAALTYGLGMINTDPLFVDAAQGDFHLSGASPCIDAGDPASDYSLEPEPNGGRINMGAYGNTPEAAPRCWVSITGYTLVRSTRASQTQFEYEFALGLRNAAAQSLDTVNLQLSGVPASAQLVDPAVVEGPMAAGATVTTTDTFILRVDRSVPIAALPISWHVSADGGPPVTLTSLLVIPGASAADLDGDGDVDRGDVAIFMPCMSGPAVAYDPQHLPEGCTVGMTAGRSWADFDADGDVDQSDFGYLQWSITNSIQGAAGQ